MKALLVASSETRARPIAELIRSNGIDVECIAPTEVVVGCTGGCSIVVLCPDSESADLTAIAAASTLVCTTQERPPLVLALACHPTQLDALMAAGADDFLLWPAEESLLRRRLELCRTRIERRDRDFIRAQMLAEAVRQAERSEQRFRHLAESSTEILTRCSPGGVRLYISPACRFMLGYDPAELLGSSILDILHPADTASLRESLDGLEHGAGVAISTVRWQRKTGDYGWFEAIFRPVRDPKTGAIEEIVIVARDITTLVHIEHSRLADEHQFEAFAARVPVGIMKVDVHGNCIFINERACELLGTTPEHVAGRGWMTLLEGGGDVAAMAEEVIKKAGDEKGYNWEMAVRRPDGEKIWLAFKGTATRDASGHVTGYVATVVDATREAQARHALLASEERFRSMVENITDLVCRYLPDGTLTYVNEAYCRTFTKEADKLVGTSFLPLLPAEERIIFDQVKAALCVAQPVVKSLHRVVMPNGEERWQEWYDRGFFDEDGRLIELVGTGRDITEQKRLEQELAEAGDFLRDVLDAVPDPISVEDDAGNFVMVNRSFSDLFGRPRDKIVGHSVNSIRSTSGDTPTSWPETSDEHEITIAAADGLLRSLSEKRAVLAARKGHRVLVSVMRDVTERKRYEAQLALSERLASLGTLAAGIAHEINNPLSYVIGNLGFATDALAEEKDAQAQSAQFLEVRKALSEALEGARRIAGIVRDVKVFSRADRETLKLVEPRRVAEASLRMVQSKIESRSRVVREFEPVPPVMGNEARLAQVLVNLLMNALQSLPSRPVAQNEIVIAIKNATRSVIVEVRDNGEGIAPDKLRHIFDPFFTTKAVGEGMGLGLSICSSIVTAHSGRIEVDSTVGVGSAFRVILPAVALPVRKPKSP